MKHDADYRIFEISTSCLKVFFFITLWYASIVFLSDECDTHPLSLILSRDLSPSSKVSRLRPIITSERAANRSSRGPNLQKQRGHRARSRTGRDNQFGIGTMAREREGDTERKREKEKERQRRKDDDDDDEGGRRDRER